MLAFKPGKFLRLYKKFLTQTVYLFIFFLKKKGINAFATISMEDMSKKRTENAILIALATLTNYAEDFLRIPFI